MKIKLPADVTDFQRNELCRHNSKSGRNYAKAKLICCDVMVHPDYQRKGIGTLIMKALLEHCQKENIKWIQLSCAKGKQPFYHKLGFTERDLDAPGMVLFYE
ncbi:GNAT family N-acetyltransferase [Lysinibacillus sp. NPDC097231]|uniref:GNAT family N-acetyltransferase n=1 Tax=Lysinibacillus sp. NPDC097231 TaxID=3364142 RepID=UPI0037F1EFB5